MDYCEYLQAHTPQEYIEHSSDRLPVDRLAEKVLYTLMMLVEVPVEPLSYSVHVYTQELRRDLDAADLKVMMADDDGAPIKDAVCPSRVTAGFWRPDGIISIRPSFRRQSATIRTGYLLPFQGETTYSVVTEINEQYKALKRFYSSD